MTEHKQAFAISTADFFILPTITQLDSITYSLIMAHNYTNINLHIIFHTKSSAVTIREEHLSRMFQYIRGVILNMSGCVYMVGGRPDHIHILLSLPVTLRVSDLVRTIKSNTSRWIKEVSPEYNNFSWQEGYGAFSVSESNKSAVINYIAHQQVHHRKYSAQEEFKLFLQKHGFCTNESGINSDITPS